MSSDYILDEEFKDINFEEIDIKFKEYENCTFHHCDFTQCTFQSVYFVDCTFFDCNFNDTKIILSVYNETDTPLEKNMGEILKFDNIAGYENLTDSSFQSFVKDAMKNVDLVIKGDEFLEENLETAFNELKGEKSEFLDGNSVEKIYN